MFDNGEELEEEWRKFKSSSKPIGPGDPLYGLKVSEPESGGMKFDQDKIDWSLLPTEATEEILKVFAFGAQKYERFNFRKGFKQTRLIAAAFRHLVSHMRGEDIDPESGLRHLGHLGCCVMMLLTNILEGKDDDDRYKG